MDVARGVVASPSLGRVATAAFKATSDAAAAMRLSSVSRVALSGLYNTVYYRGMANELGGPLAFRELMVDGTTPPSEAADSTGGRHPHLLVACYANHYVGYVVPKHEFDAGGYEAGVSVLDETAEETLRLPPPSTCCAK